MDLRRPFRHVDAIACGALTRHHLVDGSYQPLFPGVSVDARTPVTMAIRAAGALLARPRGTVAGSAAAALWDVDTAPVETTVDLLVDAGGVRSCPGVRVRRAGLRDDEVAVLDGLRVTTPVRTALDLARWLPVGQAVVVVDAFCRRSSVDVDAVRALVEVHGGEAEVGWEVLEVHEDVAEQWGTRTRPAPLDVLVGQLRRAADRWDPVPRVGGRSPGKMPRPPGPDGECDGGLSRLVSA